MTAWRRLDGKPCKSARGVALAEARSLGPHRVAYKYRGVEWRTRCILCGSLSTCHHDALERRRREEKRAGE